MDIYLETKRLIFRKFVPDDYERFFTLDSDPEVMKYIGIPPLSKVEESKEVIKMMQQQYENNGLGRLAVIDIEKESGLLIGWSGLKLHTAELNGHRNFYHLGYRFLPEAWGKAYASESQQLLWNLVLTNSMQM